MKVSGSRISLQKKIVLMVSIVTVLMMSSIIIYAALSLQNSVKQAYVSQISGMTVAINGRYEESRSVDEVQQIFDYIKYKNSRVLRLTLYNKQGVILASSERERIGQTLAGSIHIPEQDKTLVERLPMTSDRMPKMQLLAPLQEDGKVVGVVDVLFDSSEESDLVSKRVTLLVAVGTISAALLLVVLWLVIRSIVIIPLMHLREAAVKVKQGGTQPMLDFPASPEIKEVSDAFNDMVINLERRYHELQLALDSLQNAQDKLIQSEKMGALGSLVAGVSHEINTPIGIGVTAVSFLDQKTNEFTALYQSNQMKKSDLDQFLVAVSETTEMVQSNLIRASELVRSFKQVSVDQTSEVKRTFYLKNYMEEVTVSLGPALKKTKHRIMVNCYSKLEVYSYPGAISQIMTNLVMNSLHHAYEPGEEGNLIFNVNWNPERIHIVYSDDGKGMSQEVLDKIFVPFFTTKRGKGGTGLGMNIVYNLVTQSLGGTIHCYSTLGQGTLFSIEIPIEEEPEHGQQAS
jgi:two-component system NtrC family sensor kinase